jgi:uncharacterized cupin superfamily protein
MGASSGKPHPLLTAKAIAAMPEKRFVHTLNAKAVRHTRSLGDALGLTTIGIHLVRVEPGGETTEFHFHHQDEEWLYILSGRGVAEIGDERFEVAAGDFMGFVAESLPHAMRNPYGEDLVYLMGGARCPIDICDYPRLGKRRYRVNGVNEFVDLGQLQRG